MLARLLQLSVNALPWRVRLAIKHIPIVAPFQRWLLMRVLAHETFMHRVNSGPAKGLQYPVCLPVDKSIWAGTYESVFASRLAASVRPGDVCYDVGSFRGFLSGVLALAGAGCVYAFEPLPENCRQIDAMIAANPRLPIVLLRIALGREPGYTQFQVMREPSMGKLVLSRFQPGDSALTVMDAEVHSIDELVESGRIEPPNVLKIDVEGAEMMVLEGARSVLALHRPRVFVEVHSRDLARMCRNELLALGYRITVLEAEAAPAHDTDSEVSHFVCTPA